MRKQTWGAASLLLVLTTGAVGAVRAATIELISKADPVPDSTGETGISALSADGRYVAFLSDAPNLVPGQADDNKLEDVFFHDRVAGTTTLVSHRAGSPAAASLIDLNAIGPGFPADLGISADGRYAVFTSHGTDLVPGALDDNDTTDVFLWDRVTGTTTLVSHTAGEPGVTGNERSGRARISADGHWVSFTSDATNLVAGQGAPPNGVPTENVFLWHRSTGTTTLVSRKGGSTTAVGNGSSDWSEISGDGGVLVFSSTATDLVPGETDANGPGNDVFVYQRSTGALSLVSRKSGSPLETANSNSFDPRISADGRFISFTSFATNLVPGQADAGGADAFLFDRISGEMRLASRTSSSPSNAGGIAQFWGTPALSADGRYLAFASEADNLVPGQVDTNRREDVFVYDRVTGTTALVSRAAASPTTATSKPLRSAFPSLSADGCFITFLSAAADLIPGQTDQLHENGFDVFLYDRSTQSTILVSHAGGSPAKAGNGFSAFAVISANGGTVAFSSAANDLGDGQLDLNGFQDLFLYSRSSGEVANVTRSDPGVPAVTPYGPSSLGEISADGRFVAFLSRAKGLVPHEIEGDELRDLGEWDVFLRDRATGKTTLVSPPGIAPLTSISAQAPLLSADGRLTTLLVVDTNPIRYRLHLYDRTTGAWILVNHRPGSAAEPSQGTVGSHAISADGRYVAYSCTGCTLVAGQQSGRSDGAQEVGVFLYDRVTGTNTLVSHASGSLTTLGNGPSDDVGLSADGRFVTFISLATNLVAGQVDDSPGTPDVFVFDRTTGAAVLVSHKAGQAAVAGGGESPVISANGRFIAFRSFATDLVPGQTDANSSNDVFLYNRVANTTVLASHTGSSATTAGNEESGLPELAEPLLSLDASGRFLVFSSRATDLVAGMTDENNHAADVFLYDRISGTLTLISHKQGATGVTGDRSSLNARISADGRRIAFVSTATDLAPGHPANAQASLFLQDRATGARTRISPVRSSSHPSANGASLTPSLSGNGRSLAFVSDVSLVPGDFNFEWDVFVYDDGPGGTTPVPPCTLFDTRRPADGPALRSGARKTLAVRGTCGVPSTATAVAVKATVPQPRRRGSLALFPGNVTAPPAATLSFQKGQTRTGTFTVPLAADGTLAIQPTVAGNGAVHAVIEVVGYQ